MRVITNDKLEENFSGHVEKKFDYGAKDSISAVSRCYDDVGHYVLSCIIWFKPFVKCYIHCVSKSVMSNVDDNFAKS